MSLPIAPAEPVERMLVVLPTWVGDFVMATPALRAIRKRFLRSTITFLAERNLADLIRGGNWVDECVYWPRRSRIGPFSQPYRQLVAALRRRSIDLAVLFPNSFRAALIARLAGARRRVGYARDGRGFLLTDRLVPRNRRGRRFTPLPIVEYYADLVEALGCERPDDSLHLFTTPDCDAAVEARLAELGLAGHHPLVVLSPGAKYGSAKCWPAERFAAVADRWILERGAAVVVTCGPGEEPIARAIERTAREKLHVMRSPRFGLGELKSLVRRSDLLICNDAGPRHFAKAFGVPVVTVFGPTHPEWTATSYPRERIVRIDVECGPCQQRVCPLGHLKCMDGVTVDAVFEAGAALLHPPGVCGRLIG